MKCPFCGVEFGPEHGKVVVQREFDGKVFRICRRCWRHVEAEHGPFRKVKVMEE